RKRTNEYPSKPASTVTCFSSRAMAGVVSLLISSAVFPGVGRNKANMSTNRPTPDTARELNDSTADPFHHGQSRIGHGSVLIAAITSCTNTSNPSVMLAAGLLAKNAVERGLHIDPAVKTSLAPGSRVVTDYLAK